MNNISIQLPKEALLEILKQIPYDLGKELLEQLKALEEELTYELFPTLDWDREKGTLKVKTEGDDSTQTKTHSSFIPFS